MDESRTEATPADATPRDADARAESSIAAALRASGAIAGETAALAGALAQLVRSEASLSVRSLAGALGWRALAAFVALPAWALLVVAAVAALAAAWGSLALACVAVAAVHLVGAVLAFLRARTLAARAGFARTRAALGELAAPEPPA